ncbi:MAG TPA: DUF2254 domain-containing protein [Acidimicrobiales bacterium]|nr:DUF2254 domain-containing protein [Acidimicrobiales bacterium]
MSGPESAIAPSDPVRGRSGRQPLPSWRWEALRTTFWLVPTVLVLVAVLLFIVTFEIDWAVYHGHLSLPFWIVSGSAEAGREVLIGIAAANITVVGVVFSVTIVALTLASQQFGPRMMRNFVRDVGNQVTLGVFVSTFVYSILTLVAITTASRGSFVPHLSITVTEALVLVDLAVLIYFIHHIAKSIQLPEVIAGIARDLSRAIDAEFPEIAADDRRVPQGSGESLSELLHVIDGQGAPVAANVSGYLQFVGYAQLVEIATRTDSVIRLEHRPGHFIVAGRPLAVVLPPAAAGRVAVALTKAHVTGPHRTLMQDPVFAIDQLVEIAIRALSPAVNDTFTALTCIDWIAAGLTRVSTRTLVEGVYRDREGRIRLIESNPSYARMVDRAFDKIRQSAAGIPAVIIRLIDALSTIAGETYSTDQRRVLLRQAEAILRGAEESVSEPNDRDEIRAHYRRFMGRIASSDASFRPSPDS